MATSKEEEKKLLLENSPLYGRMSVVCHTVIFLYATAFWINIGVFPFLTKKLGIDTVIFGYLQTVSAIALLLGGPLFGRMGDIFGAKIVFLISFGGSFCFYFIMALANNAFQLFISQLFSFAMNAMQCAQMVMTDVTGTRDRAVAMGRLTVAYGLGMIVGPTLGGWVTLFFNEQYAAAAAASLMVLAFLIILVVMPIKTKDPRKVEILEIPATNNNDKSLFNFKAIFSLLLIPQVFYLIGVKTLVGIPAGIFHSMFSVVNMERFDLTPEMNGYILTYIGILTALMQGIGIKWFTSRFSDSKLIRVSIIVMSLAYLMLVPVNTIWLLGIVLIPMVMSRSLLNTGCFKHINQERL
ncbi:PREDICTED: solute carrier family 22 member 18-like [Amphimedon queenslandica]|uniref:Major facilitator superfamily (MFS) profile domain-containing protein n=1 Tax=Amphimedon queenslandica TaxID=400682 RepID=A0A1X7UBG1_AMPQE|nr:PREDICTED: solute carrier family 22 member 18-like [Amphimedon queenslandica]|eukprot:XP_019855205.1 PREDICTED: solute carrier family 22 member 18-like [Amphimedon queenslandica]